MSNHDDDLRALLREAADRAKPDARAETRLLKDARRRRRLTAAAATLAAVVMVGGLAGATTLLGDDGITPAPGPGETNGCVSVGYDLAVFVPEGATDAELEELERRLHSDGRILRGEFVSAEEAERKFRASKPEHEGPLSTADSSDQYRLTIKPGLDPDAVADELAEVGAGAYVPALECPPNKPKRTFARYFFEVTEGGASARGVLEVNSADPSLCLHLTSENVSASHLLVDDGVIFTFFDPDDGEDGADLPFSEQCFSGEQLDFFLGELQMLIDQSERFAIGFHRGPNDEPGLVAELVPQGGGEDHQKESGWTPLSQPPIRTEGYVFSKLAIKVTPDDDGPTSKNAALRGRITFEDSFPGKRTCRFSLLDSDGEIVGESTSDLLAAGASSGVIKDTIPVEGKPVSADIECSAERLDDPDGFLRFRRVSVERDSGTERGFFARSRSVTWEGDGDLTPQRCTISVLESDGELLFKKRSGYVAAGEVPRVVEFRFTAPSWAVDRVADATVQCRSIR